MKNINFQNEVELAVKEMKSALPGIKSQSGDNFLVKYEEAVVELILQGRELSEVTRIIIFKMKKNYNF